LMISVRRGTPSVTFFADTPAKWNVLSVIWGQARSTQRHSSRHVSCDVDDDARDNLNFVSLSCSLLLKPHSWHMCATSAPAALNISTPSWRPHLRGWLSNALCSDCADGFARVGKCCVEALLNLTHQPVKCLAAQPARNARKCLLTHARLPLITPLYLLASGVAQLLLIRNNVCKHVIHNT
jgi:hypothetical protein